MKKKLKKDFSLTLCCPGRSRSFAAAPILRPDKTKRREKERKEWKLGRGERSSGRYDPAFGCHLANFSFLSRYLPVHEYECDENRINQWSIFYSFILDRPQSLFFFFSTAHLTNTNGGGNKKKNAALRPKTAWPSGKRNKGQGHWRLATLFPFQWSAFFFSFLLWPSHT